MLGFSMQGIIIRLGTGFQEFHEGNFVRTALLSKICLLLMSCNGGITSAFQPLVFCSFLFVWYAAKLWTLLSLELNGVEDLVFW